MNYVHYIYNNVKYLYNSMNPATLSGAIDVIVVEQPDGTLLSTPFHVRFGKYGVFTYENKYVDIEINNAEIDLKMKLGENGVAFFVEKVSEEETILTHPDTANSLTDVFGHEEGESHSGGSEKIESINHGKIDASTTISATKLSSKCSPRKEAANEQRNEASSSDDESRPPSPLPVQEKRTPNSLAIQQQQRQKKALPFSSSIYSCRKNRSLPDLSNLLTGANQMETPEGGRGMPKNASTEKEKGGGGRRKKGHFRKATFGTIDMEKLRNGGTGMATMGISVIPPNARKMLQHSVSATSPLKNFPDKEKENSKEIIICQKTATQINSMPSSDDETYEKEDNNGIEMKMANGNAGMSSIQHQQASTSADLTDGALSDSEVDRHRNQPHMNDTEWKWGEIPKLPKQKDLARSTNESSAKKSRWNWFRWSRRQQANAEDGAKGQVQMEDEKGLYLQDLGSSDPSKLEKYFGKRSGPMSISSNASNIDSGNGISLGTSPCSPSAFSLSEEAETTINSFSNAQSMENLQTPTVEKEAEIVKNLPEESSKKMRTNHHQSTSPPRGRLDSGHSETSCSTDLYMSDEESSTMLMGTVINANDERVRFEKKTKYKRSLRLTSDQLKLLNLEFGLNNARFSITTKLQGTAWCSCHIFLLRWDDKLVISDIDGTITKSDVLGHVIPAIGGTWAHSGVAELYTRIKNNGYQMVYLSSRAIGQSHYTKTYLQSIAQGSETLPDGPVLLSPTSVLMAFRKEVIERRPEEFKIACLSDLKSLFPVESPFFAGFGNRETDVKSYQSVNIPLERILIIDPSGMLRRADKIGYVSDYATMAMDTVDYIFPPIILSGVDPAIQNECSEFNIWRCKPDQFDYLMDDELKEYEERRKRLASKATDKAKKGIAAKRKDK